MAIRLRIPSLTSGEIYDAIRAAGVLSIASDVTAAVERPTSSAAAVADEVAPAHVLAALGVTDVRESRRCQR